MTKNAIVSKMEQLKKERKRERERETAELIN